jgi:hypothetical protein
MLHREVEKAALAREIVSPPLDETGAEADVLPMQPEAAQILTYRFLTHCFGLLLLLYMTCLSTRTSYQTPFLEEKNVDSRKSECSRR